MIEFLQKRIFGSGAHPGRRVAALLLLGLLPLSAQDTLLENSPFLPPRYGETPAPPPEGPTPQGPLAKTIEFRSVARISDQWLFSLYNLEEKKNIWVTLSEEGSRYQISEYNPEENQLKLAYNDQTEWLPLKEPTYAGKPQTQTSDRIRRSAGTPPETQPSAKMQRPSLNRRRVPTRREVTVPRRETDSN